jgi:hypothetical protein
MKKKNEKKNIYEENGKKKNNKMNHEKDIYKYL